MKRNILRKKESGRSVYLLYTLCFFALSAMIVALYSAAGKSFVWWDDGMYQHVNSLAYYGKYLREVFSGFFRGDFELPMFDLSIGYGSDIMTTLNYYVFGDPFAFFSVFVPERFTEVLYNVLIFVRLYLCGFVFCVFIRHRGRRSVPAVLCGSLIYAFCGYMLFAGVRHPYFLNPCVFFPLVLMGIDLIFEKRSPLPFIISTAVCAVFNIYFFYMICIGMFIYAVAVYFSFFEKRRFSDLMKWFGKFVLFFAVAVLLAGTVVLPSAYALLSASRTSSEVSVPLFYSLPYYEKFLSSFLCPVGAGSWTRLALTGVSVISVALLFTRKKRKTAHKAVFCVLTLFLLLPFFGHVLNGFSYVSNRWEWMYCLLVAYIVSTGMEDMEKFSPRARLAAGIAGLVFAVLCAFTVSATGYVEMIALSVLCVTSFAFLAFRENARAVRVALCACTVFGVAVNVFLMYYGKGVDPHAALGLDYASEFHDKGAVSETLFSPGTPEAVISSLPDADTVRYDLYPGGRYNVAMQRGVNSTAFYYSVSNPFVTEYFDALYLNVPMEQKYSDSDGRLALDMLAGCRYFVASDNAGVPYGYTTPVASSVSGGVEYNIYENPDCPGLVYAFDIQFSRTVFDTLSPLQKQQAMLCSAVTDTSENETAPEFFESVKPYTVECGEGVEYDGKSFTVTKKNAEITLFFDGDALSETYICFDSVGFAPFERSDLFTDGEWASMTEKQRRKARSMYNIETTTSKLYVNISSGDVKKTMTCFNPSYSYYKGDDDFAVNLGTSAKGKTSVTLSFETCGKYRFDDLTVSCLSSERVSALASRLKDTVSDVKTFKNGIGCKTSFDREKTVVFAVPFSSGWTAYIDGEKTDAFNANVMYTGVTVGAGEHTVTLRYKTPFLDLGAVCSAIGVIALIFCAIASKRGTKRRNLLPRGGKNRTDD